MQSVLVVFRRFPEELQASIICEKNTMFFAVNHLKFFNCSDLFMLSNTNRYFENLEFKIEISVAIIRLVLINNNMTITSFLDGWQLGYSEPVRKLK